MRVEFRRWQFMRLEWPTITVIILCYALWLIVGFWLYPISPLLTLCIMVILSALHSSLTHEAIHGHPTKNRLINEALVCFPLSLIYPYRRYRQTHLLHHRNTFITDPFEDPESYYLAWWQFKPMPYPVKQLLRVNNSMAGRLIFGPILSALAFITSDIRKMSKPSSAIWLGWLLHLPPLRHSFILSLSDGDSVLGVFAWGMLACPFANVIAKFCRTSLARNPRRADDYC